MDWIQHGLINHESMKYGLIKQHNVTKSITGKIHNMEKKTTKMEENKTKNINNLQRSCIKKN